MQQTFNVAITSQRQVTYPQALVEALQIVPGQRFTISIVNQKNKLTKHESIDSFLESISGSLNKYVSKSPVSFGEVRSQAHQEVAARYHQKHLLSKK